MSDEYRAIIVGEQDARAAFVRAMAHARAMVDNGEHVLVTVGAALEPISIRQRKFLHGVALTQISEQVRVNGERFTIDAWKELYRRKFLGINGFRYEMQKLPGQRRATPRRIRISTEELGVRAYAEFTNKVIDDAVLEWGVEFIFTVEERGLTLLHKRKPRKGGDDEHGNG